MSKPSYEWYKWIRGVRLPLTIYIETLRWTAGLAVYRCIDGSGRHSYCYRVEALLPILRFSTVLTWGPRPIPRTTFTLPSGFGNIGGKTWEQRHAVEIADE